MTPDLSVVLSTYNRAEVLGRALESLLDQDFDPRRYEVVVVDNNSSDRTRSVVETFCAKATNFSYLFEPRQGVAYGRNAGIRASRAPVIAFTDDDLRVSRDWLTTIYRAFEEHPDIACVGGRVLPGSIAHWPKWLTREHWAPLALFDYGDTPFIVGASRRVCLGSGNSAYRRAVLDRIGVFSPKVQAVKREPATEDHELLLRLWRSGGRALYLPSLVVLSDIDPDRLSKEYHKRWHERHGRFLAIMRDDEFEQTGRGRLFDVPAHLYRQAAIDSVRWFRALVAGDADRAFVHEVRLRYFRGFLRTRRQDYRAQATHGLMRELAVFVASVLTNRRRARRNGSSQ